MIKIHLSRIMGEKRINIAELSRMTGLHRNGITKLYNEETDG
ncbi:helix-turn-helix transcriptional regulator, partial [Bacillus cereus]|nr:helix-turn-helix transcriptional regulator [Bacillus cereus]